MTIARDEAHRDIVQDPGPEKMDATGVIIMLHRRRGDA
jgi:hypothetical protein